MPFISTFANIAARAFGKFLYRGPSAAPSSLTVTTASPTQLNLSWVNGDNSATTEIFRDDVSIHTTAINTTTYNNSGLTSGTTYAYKIRHVLNAVTSANAGPVSGTTSVAGLASFSASAASTSQINLTCGYNDTTASIEIFRGATLIATLTHPTTTFADTGLTSATTYSYSGRHRKGAITTANSTASATTSLSAPTSLSAAALSSSSIRLTFTDTDTTAPIQVERDTVLIATLAVTGASRSPYTDSGLASATSYSYRIRNFKNSIASAYTTPNATATTTLNAPSSISVTTVNSSAITITWTSADGGASTEVEVGGSIVHTAGAVGVGSTASYTYTGLSSATTYSARVRHVKSGVYSAFTVSQSTTTSLNTPGAVTGAATGDTTGTLSWSNTDATATIQIYSSGSNDINTAGFVKNITAGSTSASLSGAGEGLTTGVLRYYWIRYTKNGYNSAFTASTSIRPQAFFTGGSVVSQVGGYRVHEFRNGTQTFTRVQSGSVEYFVVGGGAGGGRGYGGGGGGGGVLSGSVFVSGDQTVVVGGGGAASSGGNGGNGSSSSFGGVSASGGGGGGGFNFNGSAGASGGGGGGGNGGATDGGSGISGQGNAGGGGREVYDVGVEYAVRGQGGGGGKNGAGATGSGYQDPPGYWYVQGGNGGNGATNDWTGTTYTFGSGGGGSSSGGSLGGARGQGGPGAGIGALGGSFLPGAGSTNLGGGGGGGGGAEMEGAAGGSGVVIVRYPYVP